MHMCCWPTWKLCSLTWKPTIYYTWKGFIFLRSQILVQSKQFLEAYTHPYDIKFHKPLRGLFIIIMTAGNQVVSQSQKKWSVWISHVHSFTLSYCSKITHHSCLCIFMWIVLPTDQRNNNIESHTFVLCFGAQYHVFLR